MLIEAEQHEKEAERLDRAQFESLRRGAWNEEIERAARRARDMATMARARWFRDQTRATLF